MPRWQIAVSSPVSLVPTWCRCGKLGAMGGGGKPAAPAWLTSAVLPVVDQVANHAGIRQGGGIAERAVVVLGDLAQDAAHDLAGAGLGEAGRELDQVGRGDGADLLA